MPVPPAVLAAVPLALAALAGCGRPAASEEPAAAAGSAAEDAFPVTIEHTFGETTIEEQPERVVVLGLERAGHRLRPRRSTPWACRPTPTAAATTACCRGTTSTSTPR